uniref:NADH dehydrogense subunit 2 n=3 Tax=Welwitschia mirabilis TaxID=3377 RepID=A0A0X9UCM4_WELMI|nr:NADH dehydrogense subunit 2 [Welwitschia mirabilis]AMA21015.1 NADH dehydrogense subunit 2 [Welwitschia mirabilis]
MFNLINAVFPEIFLINATLILLIYGVVFSTSSLYDYPPLASNVGWLGLLSVLITILLLAAGAPLRYIAHDVLQNSMRFDDFTSMYQLFLLCCTAGTILMCFDYFEQESATTTTAFEFIVLILLSTCSMLFMISAYDLISMYLAIELQSNCFYVIAASKRNSEFSTEAGLKYLINGAFSSAILLFGCSMIYGSTGVTHFEKLAYMMTGYEITLFGARSGGIVMGILFIAVGFLFKITAVPFHMWAPDIYEGSPTLVTAFFAIAPYISIHANMLRTMHSFYGTTLQQIFFFCSIASMILGALAAMAQTKLKRLLAYSSVGHVGTICIGFSCGTIGGIQSLLIGIFIYVLMTIDAFAIVLACRQPRVRHIADLGALAGTNPLLAILFSITMFSYAGIPPLAGFCSKFYLFFAALGCGAYLLALTGVVTSVIGCFYYIRLVKIMYFDTPRTWMIYKPMDRDKSLLLAIMNFFITLFFLYPSPLFLVTHQMALSFYL